MDLDEIKFGFLSVSQLCGNKKLKIFKKFGTKATLTDYAIVLGGFAWYYKEGDKFGYY